MKLLNCLAGLLWPARCPLCGALLAPGEDALCRNCSSALDQRMPGEKTGDWFSGCLWAIAYEGQLRNAFIAYKFQGKKYYAEAFGIILANAIQKKGLSCDCLTWVPVSRVRRQQRGYDQAELLCKSVGNHLGSVPVPLLAKVRDNPAQSTLENADKRHCNVKDVYTVINPESVLGKRILLIDDVVTTGSTLAEASRVLLLAGAEEVYCAALAGRILQQQGDEHGESLERPGH